MATTWTVHVAIFMLFNVNFIYIEGGGVRRKSTACLKELNAFSVSKTTSNNASSDSTPRICRSTGCCDKHIEKGMKTQIRKDVKHLIHSSNRKMKREFDIAYDVFKAFSENVLQQTSESAIKYLQVQSSPTANIAGQVAPHIRALFKDLQKYLTERDFKIVNSTDIFFQNFFPPLYKSHIIFYKKELPADFTKCLKDKMHLIKPFQNIPQEITAMLERDMSTVKVFLQGLETAGQVLHATKKVELSTNCTASLVKMTYCSLCNRLNDSKPCLGYCSHVMSRCLKPYTDIQRYWDIFIRALDELSFLLSKSLDATKLFQKLQQKISDAMSYAVLSPEMVLKHCGNIMTYKGNGITSLKKKLKDSPTRDIDNGDLYLSSDSQNVYANLPTSTDIENQLSLVRNNLSESRIYFGNISFSLCANDGLASLDNDNCWNGTSQARYDKSSDIVAMSMTPNNSEFLMKGALQLLQMANNEIKTILARKHGDDSSSGDYSGSGDGSGTEDFGSGDPGTIPGGSGDCDDNEDCGSSGSGKENVGEKPVTSDENNRVINTSPATTLHSGASRIYKSTLTTLFCLFLCLLLWK